MKHLMLATQSQSKPELAIPFNESEVLADALVDSNGGTFRVANHKGVEVGKQYKISYNYSFVPLEVSTTERNEFSVRFVGTFGYGYGYRLNNAIGVMPPEPVYEGTDSLILTCTKTEAGGLELLRIRVTGAKARCRVWNVSLKEV